MSVRDLSSRAFTGGGVSGCELERTTASAVSISSGFARDSSDQIDIVSTGLVADLTVAGPGGLQTASVEAANTWYQALLISDSTLANPVAALLVPVGTPFVEVGYDKFRLVGYVRNDSAGNLVDVKSFGVGRTRRFIYRNAQGSRLVLTGGSNTAQTAVSLATLVPPGSEQVTLVAAELGTGPTARLRNQAGGAVIEQILTGNQQGVSGFYCPSQSIVYDLSGVGGSLFLVVSGFILEI